MRWRTDGQDMRWLEGWASRDAACAWASKLGHELDVWYALVTHGPYTREMGRCKHCDMVAGWGTLYRGKIAASLPDALYTPRATARASRGLERDPQRVMWGPALTEPCRRVR